MVIGIADKDGNMNKKILKAVSDRGDHPYLWTPTDEEDIKDLAMRIVDDIAGVSCVKG